MIGQQNHSAVYLRNACHTTWIVQSTMLQSSDILLIWQAADVHNACSYTCPKNICTCQLWVYKRYLCPEVEAHTCPEAAPSLVSLALPGLLLRIQQKPLTPSSGHVSSMQGCLPPSTQIPLCRGGSPAVHLDSSTIITAHNAVQVKGGLKAMHIS